ncbi:MAG: sulfotransferase domain-containing protein [Planctomycetota bacterium]
MPVDTPGIRFVVLASPKSGTTWAKHMLDAHPEVSCAETHPFGPVYKHSETGRPSVTVERCAFWTAEAVSTAAGLDVSPDERRAIGDEITRGYVDAGAAAMRRVTGKPVYGEKLTPYPGVAAHVVERLNWYDKDMPIVHLVRDPRDMAVSCSCQLAWARDDAERKATVESGRAFDPDVRLACEHWVEVQEAVLGSGLPNVLRVRYEDMLDSPRPMLTWLFERLGVDAEDATVDACVDAGRFEVLSGGRDRGDEDRTSFFRSGTAGDWVRWLSAAQAHWIEDRCGALLEAFGYERPPAAV